MKSRDVKTDVNHFQTYIAATKDGVEIPSTSSADIKAGAAGVDFTSQVQAAICNAGLGTVKDEFIHGWFSKVSLGEGTAKLAEFKHMLYEEIRSNITTYLPDGYRPILLAVDVARQIKRYADIITCFNTLVSRIQEEVALYMNEITEFMDELSAAMTMIMMDFDFLTRQIASIPADIVNGIGDGLIDAMEETGLMAVMQAIDDVESSIQGLELELASFSSMVSNFEDYTETQIRDILSDISDYPEELSDMFENLDNYALDEILFAIGQFKANLRSEIGRDRTAITLFVNELPEDYTDCREMYKALADQKADAQELYDKYESEMIPEETVDNKQELLDYEEEIMEMVGTGGGGTIVGGGGNSVLIINEFMMETVKSYEPIGDVPVIRPDNSIKVIYTSETGLEDALKYEYDDYYEDITLLNEEAGVELISISGGPGVIFPDGSSRFTGLARVGMHTDELNHFKITLSVEIDGEERGSFDVRGFGTSGAIFEDKNDLGTYFYKHFTQDLQMNTLTATSGDIYPIMFKDSFKIIIKKSNPYYEFTEPFFVEAGIRYMLLTEEPI